MDNIHTILKNITNKKYKLIIINKSNIKFYNEIIKDNSNNFILLINNIIIGEKYYIELNNIFNSNENMTIYIPNNNTLEYFFDINTNQIMDQKVFKHFSSNLPKTNNSIEIDEYLYKYLYDVKDNAYKHIHEIGIEKGYIYTIKQLKNHFNITNIYQQYNMLFCKIYNYYVELSLFVKLLQHKDFDYFIKDIKLIIDTQSY